MGAARLLLLLSLAWKFREEETAVAFAHAAVENGEEISRVGTYVLEAHVSCAGRAASRLLRNLVNSSSSLSDVPTLAELMLS